MRSAILALLFLGSLRWADGLGAEAPLPAPKGRTAVGRVTGRQGTCLVVALAKGATVRPGDTLVVARALTFVSLALPKERRELWGNWQEIGHLTVRTLQSTDYCIALLAQEGLARDSEAATPPPIRPGDIVCLPAAAPPPPAKAATP